MYIPTQYRQEDPAEILRYMRENPFATVICSVAEGIIATHLPVEVAADSNGVLAIRTHMAKMNPQWKAFSASKELLIIFNGPHTYISSSWYDHVNVPTWNYIAVHAYGVPRLLDDAETLASLEEMVQHYEGGNTKRFDIAQMEENDLRNHLKALVAFEVRVSRVEAKHKLSQNRNAHNFDLVIEHLKERTDGQSQKIREEMELLKKDRL